MANSEVKRTQVIVAVDGPAGSGKSSVCSEVARRIGWTYLNTGAIYRAVGLLVREAGVDMSDESAVAEKARAVANLLAWDEDANELRYKGERLGKRLYSAEAAQGASEIAKMALVRDAVLPIQRQLVFNNCKGAIVDGRDIGTVVFPDAQLKVYLTASLEERARRRLQQIKANIDIEVIKQEIAARDGQDSKRDTAPLKVADDAEILDTSDLSWEAAVEHLIAMIVAKKLLD
jgi:cytidylate kinase